MTTTYLTIGQVAELLQRHEDHIQEQLAFGLLPTAQLPGDGLVIPLCAIPPFTKPSEEDL